MEDELIIQMKELDEAKNEFRLRRKRRRRRRVFLRIFFLLLLFVSVYFFIWELRTSWLQSKVLHSIDKRLYFWVDKGPSDSMIIPGSGPYDERLGYLRLNDFIDNLAEQGFQVTSQARSSKWLVKLTKNGIFPIYREKTQAGLCIYDRDGKLLFKSAYPERVYTSFESVPKIIVSSLLYIENRELLDTRYPNKNPAIEWDRLAKALLDNSIHAIYGKHKAVGGSTMATQLEKYRHSPEGRTSSGKEKLRQMLSASLRAYIDGEDTIETRKQIIVDYINSVPLAAIPGYGEVNGLGDGLWAWYGSDFETINSCLSRNPIVTSKDSLVEWAKAYKQVLSLFLAHRRPTYYLVEDPSALDILTNRYLKLLSDAGIIPPLISKVAMGIKLELKRYASEAQKQGRAQFIKLKAVNSVRTHLASLMDIPQLYELDRLDLEVKSTIDKETQDAVTEVFEKLKDPEYAESAGIIGARMLSKERTSDVVYSFTLYERVGNANLLRVQVDSLQQPLNINEGIKLELGSTAKLRTLITYLEIIAELHERFSNKTPDELRAVQVHKADRLTAWAIEYLTNAQDKSLRAMLRAAMERRYSGNPGEAFFTGGGLHRFSNFESWENSKVATVKEALKDSINLSFIRLMRDIVNYYIYQSPGSTAKILEDQNDPRRKQYLKRFADKEGRIFITRFYRKYEKKSPEEILNTFLGDIDLNPIRLAVIFRSIKPEASLSEFESFMRYQLQNETIDQDYLSELYNKYSKDKFNLADRGYIARVHPLELWTVEYLLKHPNASLQELFDASSNERIEVYSWLFKTSHKNAQDIRIRTLIEVEAFQEIHKAWKKLGYPFDYLTPSLATSIGCSGDRPAALAELVGIILNNGVRYPSLRVEKLYFGKGTPYETVLELGRDAGERVMRPEIAEVVKDAMIAVVQDGTAKRVNKAFVKQDGTVLPVGGKTGTGDNRREIYGPRGRLIETKILSRTGTFVFFIGDRFYGTITAYVEGPKSSEYKFTSTLPVQLLKVLSPKLMPLILRNERSVKRVEQQVKLQAPAKTTHDISKSSSLQQKPVAGQGYVNEPTTVPSMLSSPHRKVDDQSIAKGPSVYTLKLGTFSSRENAEALIKSLDLSGSRPRIKQEVFQDRTLYHVYIGSFDSAQEADNFGKSLISRSPHVTNYLIRELPK